MFLINGNWQNNLSVTDRAIQFGDGCFTTARILGGQVQLLARHIQRLCVACSRLSITPPDWRQLSEEMQQLARLSSPAVSEKPQQSSRNQAVLKVIISRGSGGRGYSPAACHNSTRILWLTDYPQHYDCWRQQGVKLALSAVRLGCNPLLAGIKHLNRLEQVLIRQQLASDAQEALVLDSDGMLIECAAANLFWCQGNDIFTPQLEQCGVAGVMRQYIIDLLEQHGRVVHQVRRPLADIQHASEMLICNALMPVLPVRQAQHWLFDCHELYHFLAPLCEAASSDPQSEMMW